MSLAPLDNFLWHCCTDISKDCSRSLHTSKPKLPRNIHPSAIFALRKAEKVSEITDTQQDKVGGRLHKGVKYTSFKPSVNARAWNGSSPEALRKLMTIRNQKKEQRPSSHLVPVKGSLLSLYDSVNFFSKAEEHLLSS